MKNLKESKEKYVYVSEGQVQKVLQEPAAHLKGIKNRKIEKSSVVKQICES